jgi:hypothetical protein
MAMAMAVATATAAMVGRMAPALANGMKLMLVLLPPLLGRQQNPLQQLMLQVVLRSQKNSRDAVRAYCLSLFVPILNDFCAGSNCALQPSTAHPVWCLQLAQSVLPLRHSRVRRGYQVFSQVISCPCSRAIPVCCRLQTLVVPFCPAALGVAVPSRRCTALQESCVICTSQSVI